MRLTPDQNVLWEHGFFKLNATILTTWILMAILATGSWLVTRRLTNKIHVTRGQAFLEVVVTSLADQLLQIGLENPRRFLPFLGSLFLFLAASAIATIIPGYEPPTGSLSTTAALALCIFVAVPVFGVLGQGLGGYLKSYLQPTFLMLPFNIIGEVTRTLALAVRLFGNMMSGSMILAILITIAPLLFPIVMSALGLLTGMVQAYIFSVLATVYIAAAVKAESDAGPAKGESPIHG